MSSDQSDSDSVLARGLLDRFTAVDEHVQTTNQLLSAALDRLDQQAQALAAVAEANTGEDRTQFVTGPREFPFSLSSEVPAETSRLDPLEVSFEAPYDSVITKVDIGWTPGAQQAVGVQLGTPGGTRWVPRGGTSFNVPDDGGDGLSTPEYLAEDDRTISVSLNVEIDEGEPVQASFISNDPDENHFVTVIPFLRERRGGD